jgi:hypothetical protein
MKRVLWIVVLLSISSVTFAQKAIKAKDAPKYVGKKVTIIGTIKSVAGPGYLTSMSFYLVTDSVDVGIAIVVPMKIWSKSKVFNENQKGKIMKVTGLIKLNGEPYTEVENISDVKIME